MAHHAPQELAEGEDMTYWGEVNGLLPVFAEHDNVQAGPAPSDHGMEQQLQTPETDGLGNVDRVQTGFDTGDAHGNQIYEQQQETDNPWAEEYAFDLHGDLYGAMAGDNPLDNHVGEDPNVNEEDEWDIDADGVPNPGDNPLDNHVGGGPVVNEEDEWDIDADWVPDPPVLNAPIVRWIDTTHNAGDHNRSYPCRGPGCPRVFDAKGTRKQHERIHFKVHLCPFCDRPFADTAKLGRHLPVHTGVRGFRCAVCDLSFKRGDALRKHERTKKHIREATRQNNA